MEDDMDLFELRDDVKLPPPLPFSVLEQLTKKAMRDATPEQKEQLARGLEAARNVRPLEE